MKRIATWVGGFTIALACVLLLAVGARTAVTQLSGLAVAQTSTKWTNVRDAFAGDALTNGILASALMMYDGTGNVFNRLRGSITNGVLVDVTRSPGSNQTPADGFANPTTFQGTWALPGIFNGTTWDRWRGESTPVQGPTLFNSLTTGANNTAVTVTINGVANQNVHLYSLSAFCINGGTSFVNVNDGATLIDQITAPLFPAEGTAQYNPALTISTGSTLTLTLSACGAGNPGRLIVQADQF